MVETPPARAFGPTGRAVFLPHVLIFEAVWRASDLDVLAPVRELGLTREWEIEYAAEMGLPVEAGNDGEWSIDTNLWSRSVEGGDLEDPGYQATEAIYDWTDAPTGDTETVESASSTASPRSVSTASTAACSPTRAGPRRQPAGRCRGETGGDALAPWPRT
jgi:hypothetical protein